MIPLPPTRRTRSAVSGSRSRFSRVALLECDAFRIAFRLGANFPKAPRGTLAHTEKSGRRGDTDSSGGEPREIARACLCTSRAVAVLDQEAARGPPQ